MDSENKSPLEFSVPYNGDPETLDAIFELKELNNNVIGEVYLSGPQNYSGSGRYAPKIDLQEFAAVVDRIRAHGLRPNLVLNTTCEGAEWYAPENMETFMKYIQTMYEEHALTAVTIANPLYITAVKHRFPNITISASVLSEINCVQRAQHYVRAGADIISPDVNINRNLKLLKQIKEVTGTRLKLLVNEGCLYRCPFRLFHFNAMSHISKTAGNPEVDASVGDFFGACTNVVTEDASEIFRSCWIRPEDTRKYSDITNYFKIVGRGQRKSMIVRTIKAYMEEKWDGDLLDILSGACRKFSYRHGGYISNKALEHSFFKMVTSCDKDCVSCSYCSNLAETVVYSGVHTPEKSADLGL